MITLNRFISEKLKLGQNSQLHLYNYFPKNRYELRKILHDRLKEDKDADLNDIDVSKITNMRFIFDDLNPYNIKIDKWNVSNAEDMTGMFSMCENFNCNLSDWDVSNVQHMSVMFTKCTNLNCDLGDWDVSNVKDMKWMFDECTTLEKNNLIPKWYKEI